MKLRALSDRLLVKKCYGALDIDITDLETDSRKAGPGHLFICLNGMHSDGHDFARDALARGAAAIVAERELDLPAGTSVLLVPDTRRAMAVLADEFYGRPSGRLKLIGVTGTNGKTTVTHMIQKLLNDARYKAGLIGTMYMRFGDVVEKTPNTTPDVIPLQSYLRRMADGGADSAVLEVSSHALAMGRVRGCRFRTAVFMNLTHDHLDYHETMEKYREAKGLLFSQLGNGYELPTFAVLNADDEASDYYASVTSAQVIRFGIRRAADVRAEDIVYSPAGTVMRVVTFAGEQEFRLPLLGEFNVYNTLACVAVGLAEGIPLDMIAVSLESFTSVKGRFERVDAGQGFTIIIDYAHNPDGLDKVLATSRAVGSKRVISVVGCEGDRDKHKRPVMARVAVSGSDIAVFTSDNTRSEDPEAILSDMKAGLEGMQLPEGRYWSIADRREAIRKALSLATGPDDLVLIAGKGHETHQIVGTEAVPFDDKEVVLELLREGL